MAEVIPEFTDIRDVIKYVAAKFGRIYLGGIPSLLNDDAAFLSFICTLTAIEALAGYVKPQLGNGPRFKCFVKQYFPDPYPAQADALWEFRNNIVHGFSTAPYSLTHHNSHVHLTQNKEGLTILNAEDFYASLVVVSKSFFDDAVQNLNVQKSFRDRVNDLGVLVIK